MALALPGDIRRIIAAAATGGMILPAAAALAQEAGLQTLTAGAKPPPRLVFTLKTGVNADTNRSLSLIGKDPATTLDTNIALAYSARTRVQSFDAALGALLRYGHTGNAAANGSTAVGNGMQEPVAKLAYGFDNGASSVTLRGYYRKAQVNLSEPLTLSDGTLSPTDLIATTGSVVSWGASAGLETGKRRAVGFLARLSADRRNYSNNTNSGVYSSSTDAGSLGLRFHIDPVTRFDAIFGYSTQRYEDPAHTHLNTRQLTLDYGRMLPDGSASFSLSAAQDNYGPSQSLQFGRSFTLRTVRLDTQAGLSFRPGNGPSLIGSLGYLMKGEVDSFSASLSRSVAPDATNATVNYTVLSLGYRRQLTPLAGVSFSLSAARASASTATNRQSFNAAYSYKLTPDWSLNAGYSFRHLDAPPTGRATSNSIFVTLGRSFTLLP